ncbi:endonuclease V [Candidatus Woesearchaeota archaeon]|nr:endonuclease V [Candidatus Woesearchaeota archaeon]
MYLDLGKLKKEQLKLAKSIVTRDDFESSDLLGGCDFSYWDKTIACTIVVYDTKEKKIVESQTALGEIPFPYIPDLLFYREGPIAIETYHQLQIRPSIMFVAGQGILHPRGIGIASQLGLVLDIPTIGIAHKPLFGEIRGNDIYCKQEKAGAALVTRQFSKPIIISPGYKVSLKTAIQLMKDNCIMPHKLPEPLHLAHKYATKRKKDATGKDDDDA